MEHLEVFKKNYLVLGLSDEAVEELAELGDYGVATAGETLVDKAEENSDLIVILDGAVSICTAAGDAIAKAGPGTVIGEVGLVDDQPRSASVRCDSRVQHLRFPAKALRSYMWSNRENGFIMLANLSRVLSTRLRTANVAVEDLKAKADDPWRLAVG